MGLKPLPYEQPSATKVTGETTKQPRHRKLRSRINKTQKQTKSDTPSDKLLKQTCTKILGYLDGKGKKSLTKVKELELLLQRSIMALHKDKRNMSQKKKKP